MEDSQITKQAPPIIVRQERPPGNTLAIISLILGIVAIVALIVFFVMFHMGRKPESVHSEFPLHMLLMSYKVAADASFCGLIVGVIALRRKTRRRRTTVIGVLLSVIAVAVVIVLMSLFLQMK